MREGINVTSQTNGKNTYFDQVDNVKFEIKFIGSFVINVLLISPIRFIRMAFEKIIGATNTNIKSMYKEL